MEGSLRVLIVEDSEDDAALVLRELRRSGYDLTCERVDTPEAMGVALDNKAWDIVLCDYNMPQFNAPAAMELLKTKGLDLPFIIVSGKIGEETAVAAMKAGANDYVMKGNLARLVPAIEREIKEAKIRQERRKAEEKIQYLAYHDLITDLPNRAKLLDLLSELIQTSRLGNSSFALLFLDINRFKEINNTLGYHNGDILLKQMGGHLQETVPEAEIVACLGGDKFALVLARTDIDGATRVAKRIIKSMEKTFSIEGFPLELTVNIGISVYPGHGEDPNTLICRADIAMYFAKGEGGDYAVYSPQYDNFSPHRLILMGELRHAIDSDQLFLLYQPKLDLKTGRTTGAEALVRWKHPKSGVIPPDQFIAMAESTGIIKELTYWVLKEAVRQSRTWRQDGIEISVAVNLSVRNLQTRQLLDQIEGLLSTWGTAPDRLRLEITESIIMADPARAMEILAYLTTLGIRFSIDDFGTGYSSLGYLKRLPVDELKIDKSFVMNMIGDENDAMIVRSVIELAHNLGLKVTAEGVENKEILNKLASLGCDAAQGYFIGKPMNDVDFKSWLTRPFSIYS